MTSADGGIHRVRHLVDDVQRFGLLSAVTVVDRYIAVVDRAMAEVPLASPRLPSEGRDIGWLADSAARMAETWLRVLDATAGLIPAAAAPRHDIVVLPTGRPGCTSEASLWVHNPTDSPVAAVDLHATTLVSGNGLGLPADSVSFTPKRVALVEPGASREIRVMVHVPLSQSAGQYHGLLVSSAAPDEPVTLRVEVKVGADTEVGEDGHDGRRG
jgi:hypothetical protein